MRISDLAKDTRTISVVYKVGDIEFTVEVEYRTQAITIPVLKALREAVGYEHVLTQIVKLIARWDLQDNNDKEIPVTTEAIESNEIPYYLLVTILEEIKRDIRADDESKKK